MTSVRKEIAALSPAWSKVSLGVMTFGAPTDGRATQQITDQRIADRMIRMARDGGVTLFDVADAYQEGSAEEMLGKALAGSREEVLIASKVGNKFDDDPSHRGLRPEWIRHSIEGTLKRLDTDYVDVYYFHVPDYDTPVEESLGAMAELVEEGKVRVPAASNYASWQMAQMDCINEKHGWTHLGAAQNLYSLVARRLEDEFIPYSKDTGVFNVIYNPLAGGLLTGKHKSDVIPEQGRFARANYRDRYWNEQQFKAVEEYRSVAEEAGLSLLELALRWVLSKDGVGSVLLGASNEEQLRANLDACAGGPLPADVLERCDDVWPVVGGTAPRYNR